MRLHYDFTTGLEGRPDIAAVLKLWDEAREKMHSEAFLTDILTSIHENRTGTTPLMIAEKAISELAGPLTEERHKLQPDAPGLAPFLGSVFLGELNKLSLLIKDGTATPDFLKTLQRDSGLGCLDNIAALLDEEHFSRASPVYDTGAHGAATRLFNATATDYLMGDLDGSFRLRNLNTAINLVTSGLDNISDFKMRDRRLDSLRLTPKRAAFIRKNEKLEHAFKFGLERDVLAALVAVKRSSMPYDDFTRWREEICRILPEEFSPYDEKVKSMMTAGPFMNVSNSQQGKIGHTVERINNFLQFAAKAVDREEDGLVEKVAGLLRETTWEVVDEIAASAADRAERLRSRVNAMRERDQEESGPSPS